MPFAAATVSTNKAKGIGADRVRTTPGTFTTSPKFIAVGVGATAAARTAAVGDTALSTEVESRTSGTESTVTTTQANDTYRVSGTVTMTATRAIDEGGTFDAASAGNIFVSWTQLVDNFNSGDSYQVQVNWQLT